MHAAPPPELLSTEDRVHVFDDLSDDGLLGLIAQYRPVVWGDTLPAPVEILDLTGETCPFTFVRTKLRLEELPLGATLRVIVDHEPASRNVPRSAREWGQEVLAERPVAPGHWIIDIVKRKP
ncbi:MAG: sulfurtransferase TusA family protein [Deltaproteobacteria bacterium]|nr:sulfurtransferase TusA family protein [Deltaproteobacteria bacterium]